MNKKELWDKFIRTGKVSDYLSYRRAEKAANDAEDIEVSEDIYPDCPYREDYGYDNQNGRYSDS